jgi:hypothetical protein
MNSFVSNVLPSQPEALIRPQSAVDQQSGGVPKDERVVWLDRPFVPHWARVPFNARS